MTQGASLLRRIIPEEFYSRNDLIDGKLCTEETIKEMERYFGLFHVFGGGGGQPFLYLGKTLLEAIERRGRREFVDPMPGPMDRDEIRERVRREKGQT